MNGLVRRGTERVIARVKHDPDYRLEGDYDTRDLVEALAGRGREVARGLFLAWKVAGGGLPLFAGRRIRVHHGRMVTIGSGSIVDDDVLLNGLSRHGLHIGRNVTIGRGTTITCLGVIARPGTGIWIGDRTGIGEYSHIGGQGGVHIGTDVLFGPGVRVFSENHEFGATDRLIREQGERRDAVRIDDDCWIGAGAIILAGVHIESGAVIGAGSVVTRSVPSRSIVAGVPARVIGTRGTEQSAVGL